MANERTPFLSPAVPDVASDSSVRQEKLLVAPEEGLLEGIDAAAIGYPASAAPALQNIRLSRKTWLTRLGQQMQYMAPGSGAVRLLDFLYQQSGAFTWLLAQGTGAGAQLYELKVGTDTGFVVATGGAGLGGTAQPYFQGTTMADQFYLTDRQNALYKYSTTNTPTHLIALTVPTGPAAGLTCVPRPFTVMENYWTAWTADSPGNFNQSSDAAANPSPDSSQSSHLNCVSAAALGHTVTSTDFRFPAPLGNYVGGISHAIAFWVKHDLNADAESIALQVQYGTNTATDYSVSMSSNQAKVDTWYPFFIAIGDLGALNFLRVFVQACKGGGSYWNSSMILPGTLEGPYRWVYTYYDSVNLRESAPSPISNNGQPLDFSTEGVSFDMSTAAAFAKACLLIPVISGDASVDTIRIYRNGGVPSLSVDANGLPLWLFVDSLSNFATTTASVVAAGDNAVVLTAIPAGPKRLLQAGDWLVFEPGVQGKQEALQVVSIVGTTVTLTNGLNYGLTASPPNSFAFAHASGVPVRACYVDNTPNESIQVLNTLDVPIYGGEVTRGAPVKAARYIQRSPQGRLWAFNYTGHDPISNTDKGHPNGVAISNLATPFRPTDYESFTFGVDPLTRASETMGWNFDIFLSLAQDEEIEWGGFFRGWATIITRNRIYQVTAHSQAEWAPTTVVKIADVGCLPNAGDTVREVDGVLYWVAPGPKVMAWDGSSDPQDISFLKCSVRLKSAPASEWAQWFAVTHRRQEGRYYCLYFASAAGITSGADQRLDYNIDLGLFEPCIYFNGGGTAINYAGAFATDVPGKSIAGLYQVDASGNVWQAETGLLDGSVPIQILFKTPAIPLFVHHQVWFRFLDETLINGVMLRLPAVSDTVSMTLATDHGEYPPVAHSYSLNLLGNNPNVQNSPPNASPGTIIEIWQRAHRDLIGRALQITISGSVSNQPEFDILGVFHVPMRHGRVSG
jgi:hypothetical protein